MNRIPLRVLFVSLAIISFAARVHAQVSFLQPPTYAGYGSITFAADFNNDGKLDLLTPDGTMNLGNGDGTFTPGTNVTPPGGPSVFAVADFNGDGKPDVLEQNTNTGELLVLLGNGDGTFQAPISTAIGAVLSTIAAADLNGDGKADVVGLYGNLLFVYIGNGDGTFKSGVSYNLGVTPGGSPILSLGDFDGNAKTDVVVSIAGTPAGEEIVFLGNGDGTLQSPKTSPSVSSPSFVDVVDFNGDGKLDLAISCYGCSPQDGVFLLLGNGDGTFQTPTALLSVFGQSVFAATDLNGDGQLDLVVEQDPSIVQIYLQNTDGTFSNDNSYVMTMPTLYFGYAGYTGIVISDFNHDGKLDIAAENGVLLGNGDGTFQGIQFSSFPATPTTEVVGDFENNGRMDVAAISGASLYILRNNGQGKLALLNTYTLQQPSQGIVTADFNRDGKLDLVVFGTDQSQNWNYSVLLGNGDGSFQSPVYYSQAVAAGSSYGSFAVADFNNDQKPDLALITGNQTQPLTILLGNGDGTFAAPAYYFDGGAGWFVVADFNSDGNLDIAVPSSGTGILYGKGDGTFQPIVFPASLSSFAPYFTADFNNDGKADLLGYLEVALGNGDGTFKILPSTQNGVSGIADFNGDGNLDLFVSVAGCCGKPVASGIQLGNGDGTFAPFIQVPSSANGMLWSSFSADMNGDGKTDIVFPWDALTSEPFRLSGFGVILNTTPAGFELSAGALSPSQLTAGNSATSTVNVLPTFGFNTAAALSCSGLPRGAACTFNPPSIAGSSGKSMLTISTSTSTAGGSYPVQVTGTAGAVTSSTTLSLVVQGVSPDFSVGPASGSPTSQTITAGQTANFSLAIAPSGGFSGTLNLSCAITPSVTPPPTCNVPSSMQIGGTGSQPVSVAVVTTSTVTTSALPDFRLPPAGSRLLWIFGLLSTVLLLARGRKRIFAFALSVVIMGAISLLACGGSSGGPPPHTVPGTPAGKYTVTVTATSGGLSHNTVLQVVVQ